MLHKDGYDGCAADVWSLGGLALEVSCGSDAFSRHWFAVYSKAAPKTLP